MAQMILHPKPLLLREYPEPIEQRSVKGLMGRRVHSTNLSGSEKAETLNRSSSSITKRLPPWSKGQPIQTDALTAEGEKPNAPTWVAQSFPRNFNRLRPVSPKRAKQNQEYERVKKVWWAARLEIDGGRCQFIHFGRCNLSATRQPHHIYGRGKYLSDSSTFLAVCPFHHNWIHEHPKQAREAGLLK